MSGKMLPAAGELERPIVTPTETNRNVTQFPNPNRRFSPIKNRPSIICQYISSKFVELEKYMRLHETMEKMLMSTRVNFRPSWSNTVAESKPPNGHTKVLMEAAIKALKFTTWNCLVCHNLTFFISHIKNEFFLSLQTLQLNKQTLAHRTNSPDRHLISADYCRPLVLRALWLESPAPFHSTEPKHSPVNCRQSCRGNIKVQR